LGDVLEPVISGETEGNESVRWRGKIVNKGNGEHPRIIRLRMQSHLEVGHLMGIGIIPRTETDGRGYFLRPENSRGRRLNLDVPFFVRVCY
jgi:hypothetical protein